MTGDHGTPAIRAQDLGKRYGDTLALDALDLSIAPGEVWQLLSGVLEAPQWLRDVSPFQHVGLVPAQGCKAIAAATMHAIAAAAAAAAVLVLRRRDLTGV